MSRGEYHLALADYGRAMNTSPRNFGLPRNPDADAARREAQEDIARYLQCGGDPEKLPAAVSEAARDAVRSARLPSGHLVVAAGGGVLAVYPLTDEGRRAAVAHADVLAADSHERFRIDNLYLAENDDFDAVVYAHEGGRAVEVYRAEPREEAEASGEE